MTHLFLFIELLICNHYRQIRIAMNSVGAIKTVDHDEKHLQDLIRYVFNFIQCKNHYIRFHSTFFFPIDHLLLQWTNHKCSSFECFSNWFLHLCNMSTRQRSRGTWRSGNYYYYYHHYLSQLLFLSLFYALATFIYNTKWPYLFYAHFSLQIIWMAPIAMVMA